LYLLFAAIKIIVISLSKLKGLIIGKFALNRAIVVDWIYSQSTNYLSVFLRLVDSLYIKYLYIYSKIVSTSKEVLLIMKYIQSASLLILFIPKKKS